MTTVGPMLALPVEARLRAEAVVACRDAASAATDCAEACRRYGSADERTDCVPALLTAAEVATTTARILSRTATDPDTTRVAVTDCWIAARHAREQCRMHLPVHRYRGTCARAIRRAEQACCDLLGPTP